jgi:hypothetical protein
VKNLPVTTRRPNDRDGARIKRMSADVKAFAEQLQSPALDARPASLGGEKEPAALARVRFLVLRDCHR